jgi:hypothetical protein
VIEKRTVQNLFTVTGLPVDFGDVHGATKNSAREFSPREIRCAEIPREEISPRESDARAAPEKSAREKFAAGRSHPTCTVGNFGDGDIAT